jgi:hypothetical protein
MEGRLVMKNAFEYELELNPRGRTVKRRVVVGGVVVWGVVALAAITMGKALVSLPPSFWDFFKR